MRTWKKMGAVLLAAVLVVVAGCTNQEKNNEEAAQRYDYILNNESVAEKFLITNLANKEIGIPKKEIRYAENLVYAVSYPVFGVERMDESVAAKVKDIAKQIEKAKKDAKSDTRAIVNVDYESYTAKDRIVSIVYNIYDYSAGEERPMVDCVVQRFDLATEKETENSKIFTGEYLNFFSQYCDYIFRQNPNAELNIGTEEYKKGIEAKEENYKNVVPKTAGVEIIFSGGQIFPASQGVSKVFIPYDELTDYVKALDLSKHAKSDDVAEKTKRRSIPAEGTEEKTERNVDATKPMVALTFDDGPSPKATARILDALKKVDGRATFFLVGERVKEYSTLVKREFDEGHQIGNHTYDHTNLTKLTAANIAKQISRTDEAIEAVVGARTEILRPTYGAYNDAVKKAVPLPMINWSLDTLDWKSRNAASVVSKILDNVKDGDIVLMHDLYESTAEAVEQVIPKLVEKGYQLVTVSEMMEAKGKLLEAGVVYHDGRIGETETEQKVVDESVYDEENTESETTEKKTNQ